MSIERQMFINNDTSTISVSITAYESVGVYAMRIEGDFPPGAIWGFGVYNGVSYTNPDPTTLTRTPRGR